MKKIFVVLSVVAALVLYSRFDKASKNEYMQTETLVASTGFKEYMKIKDDIDNKMLSIFQNLKQNQLPTNENVVELIAQIKALRGWGGDMSEKSKVILEQLVSILKSKNQNAQNVIDELEIISQTSVNLYS